MLWRFMAHLRYLMRANAPKPPRTLTRHYPPSEIIVKQNACHQCIFLRLYDKILM